MVCLFFRKSCQLVGHKRTCYHNRTTSHTNVMPTVVVLERKFRQLVSRKRMCLSVACVWNSLRWRCLVCASNSRTWCQQIRGDRKTTLKLWRKQVVSTRHSATSGGRVIRARSCSEGRAGSQWHGRHCSGQDIDIFLSFFSKKKA